MAQNNKHFFSVSVGWEFRSSLAGWFLAGPASPEGLTGLRIYFQEGWLTWLFIGGYSSSLAVGRRPHFLSTKTAPQGFLSDPTAWQLVFPRINDPKESQNYDIPRKLHSVIPIISHWRHRKVLTSADRTARGVRTSGWRSSADYHSPSWLVSCVRHQWPAVMALVSEAAAMGTSSHAPPAASLQTSSEFCLFPKLTPPAPVDSVGLYILINLLSAKEIKASFHCLQLKP